MRVLLQVPWVGVLGKQVWKSVSPLQDCRRTLHFHTGSIPILKVKI